MDPISLGISSAVVMLLSIPLSFYFMFKKLDAAERYVQYSVYLVVHRHIFRNAPFEGRPQRLFAVANRVGVGPIHPQVDDRPGQLAHYLQRGRMHRAGFATGGDGGMQCGQESIGQLAFALL